MPGATSADRTRQSSRCIASSTGKHVPPEMSRGNIGQLQAPIFSIGSWSDGRLYSVVAGAHASDPGAVPQLASTMGEPKLAEMPQGDMSQPQTLIFTVYSVA